MAIEESLNLDLGPALAAIRGELTREIENIPNTLRDSFGTALVGMTQDVGAFAELAKGELDRVLGETITAPVEVDTSQVAEASAIIDAAGQPIDAPVVSDTSEVEAAVAEIAAASGDTIQAAVAVDTSDLDAAVLEVSNLDGETVTVAVEADTSGIAGAQQEVESLTTSATASRGAVEGLGGALATSTIGAGKLSGTLEQLGGAGFAVPAGIAAGLGLFAKEAIYADEVTRSFNLRVGDLATTLERVDVAGLNTSLSDLAIKVGASDEGLRLALARFVSLSEGSGRAREEVGKMGQELTALAANLSVTNPALGSADEVLNSLPAALARGGRALTPFGIAINAASIQTRALADSGKETAADLTIFDRAAAGLALTMEKLGPSLKTGLEEGAATAAIQLKSLKTALGETIETAGRPLIEPVVESLKAAQPILLSTATAVGTLGQGVGDVLVPVLKVVGPIVEDLAKALDAIPQPLIEGAAAAALAYKAYAPLAAGLSLVRGAITAIPALFSASVVPVSALTLAEEAHAAAAIADAAAQQALVVAEAELVIAATADTAAIVGLAVAQTAAIGSAVALTAAEEELAVAAATATTALGPIALAATAAAAAIAIVTLRSDGLKFSVTDLAKATNAQLLKVFQDVRALGRGDDFFEKVAKSSTVTAQRLRDSLQATGADVSRYTAVLDEMADHERTVAAETAAVAGEFRKLDAAVPASVHSLQEYVSAQGAAADTAELLVKREEALQATLDANKKALDDQSKAAQEVAQGFRDATSALAGLIGKSFDATTQDLQFSISLDKLKASQDEVIKSKGRAAAAYNLETVAGRENLLRLGGEVKAQAELVATNIAAGESIQTATNRYAKQVEQIGKVAEVTGLTKKQYDDYLKVLGLTPTEISTKIAMTGIPEAKTAADGLKSYIELLDPKVVAKLTLDEVQFFQAIDRVKAKLSELGPSSGDVNFAADFAVGQLGAILPGAKKAYGGIVYGAAQGGLTSGIYSAAQGVQFNEADAKGEAYIPFAMDRRERATQVLGATADQFGYALVPQARQPLTLPSGSAAAGGDGGGGVAVLERIASLLDKLPERMPAGVTANVTLTTQEADVLGQLADRLRGH